MKDTCKSQIKNIVGSVVFLSIAIVMFVCVSYMLRPIREEWGNRDAFSVFYSQEKDSLDVVTLGSSGIYRFFNNPVLWEEYGITSVNLATGAQPVGTNRYLIEEIYKTQTPDVILVETRGYVNYAIKQKVKDVRFRRVSDYMDYSWNRIRMINDYEKDWEKRLQLYFDISFYHGEWESFRLSDIRYADNRYDTDTKGWGNVYKINAVSPVLSGEVQMKMLDPEREKDLRDLIAYAKEKDAELLFVATPWMIDEETAAKNLHIQQIVEESGYRFLDCNLHIPEIGLSYERHFYDESHVNVWGSEMVTRYLGNYIEQNYTIEKNHSKQVKKEWDKALKAYHDTF